MCNPTRKPTDGTVPIRFGTYNIRNGRKGGLEAALRGMVQANMDLGILQEKNSQMASTPAGRRATTSSRRMRQADTAVASHFLTASHPISW